MKCIVGFNDDTLLTNENDSGRIHGFGGSTVLTIPLGDGELQFFWVAYTPFLILIA